MTDDYDTYATPTLMRAARGAYAQAMRSAVAAAGFDDLPLNGAFILAGIDTRGGPRGDLPAGLGVSKQAVSQAIEVLVGRGFIERRPDTEDRRRNILELTDRGRQVLDCAAAAVGSVDQQLQDVVTPEEVAAMRRALGALARIKGQRLDDGTSTRRRPRDGRQFRRFSPIFKVDDLAVALNHYRDLGFQVEAYEAADEYGFAQRDGIDLHLSTNRDRHPSACYLYVDDADALYAEWSRPGIGGTTRPPGPTDYRLKEGSHTDPDGNLIRYGSPLE
ncbi:MAG TPA: MarR family transcriptional regulator [Acidimicrobiales bacterium]|nr:MarR family transcriptional regulator [Acidimicrobiales bacterium]